GAVRGRWRFRPPCTAAAPGDKACTPPPTGVFTPAPREIRAVLEGVWAAGQTLTQANGLVYGQYHAPMGEYIFPEQVAGAPVPAANFGEMPWLKNGGYSSAVSSNVAGPIAPWVEGPGLGTDPGTVLPVVTAALSATNIPSGGTVTLFGAAVSPTPIQTWTWALTANGAQPGFIAAPGLQSTTYPAPQLARGARSQPVTFTLTARNVAGTAVSAPVSLTIEPPQAPIITGVSGVVTAVSGQNVSMTARCID